jgi:hypothetical protein
MSQIPSENDDNNRPVAASDFVKVEQPDEVPDQEAQQQHGQQQNQLGWSLDSEESTTTHNFENDLKEQKLMIANLQVFLESGRDNDN